VKKSDYGGSLIDCPQSGNMGKNHLSSGEMIRIYFFNECTKALEAGIKGEGRRTV
jgi:hypothetical protein